MAAELSGRRDASAEIISRRGLRGRGRRYDDVAHRHATAATLAPGDVAIMTPFISVSLRRGICIIVSFLGQSATRSAAAASALGNKCASRGISQLSVDLPPSHANTSSMLDDCQLTSFSTLYSLALIFICYYKYIISRPRPFYLELSIRGRLSIRNK